MRTVDPVGKDTNGKRARAKKPENGRGQQTNALDAVQREDLNGFDISALFDQFADHDYRGMLVINPRRQVLAMNPVSRELLSFDDVLPQSVASVVHDPHFEFAVGDALHDRHPAWHETYVPNPDRLLRFHIVPVTSDAGEPQVLVVSVEDATRLRHLETVRKDFVANVSHELRTPIASINLLVETLQRGAIHDPDAAMHFLHRIQVETHAMAQLVEELLELSRLETGGLSLNTEDIAVAELLGGGAEPTLTRGRGERCSHPPGCAGCLASRRSGCEADRTGRHELAAQCDQVHTIWRSDYPTGPATGPGCATRCCGHRGGTGCR